MLGVFWLCVCLLELAMAIMAKSIYNNDTMDLKMSVGIAINKNIPRIGTGI